MKKILLAASVALTMGVANADFSSINTSLTGIYSGLNGTFDGSNGHTALGVVNTETNEFVEAFRDASGGVDFDANSWTLSSTTTSVVELATARDELRVAETDLLTQVTTDLVGNGDSADTWNAAALATARANGGLLGILTADIQEATRDLTDVVATADIQEIYETDGALESFFVVTGDARDTLQTLVNDTREGVANARDGFGLSSVVVGANTGSIVVDADGNDVRESILTNGDHILVSDYFTAAVGVYQWSN